MARRRFSKIMEAARLYQAVDNYKTWLTNFEARQDGIGTGGNRPTRKLLYVIPFGIELPTDCKAKTSSAEPAFNAYSSYIGNKVSGTAPVDAANILRPYGFKAARVIVTTGKSSSGTTKTSTVTGLKYLSYGGQSQSVPFGKNLTTDEELATFATIKNAILAAFPTASVSLKEEEIAQ